MFFIWSLFKDGRNDTECSNTFINIRYSSLLRMINDIKKYKALKFQQNQTARNLTLCKH